MAEGEDSIDLKSCSDVCYVKWDGTHGVPVCDEKDKKKWTPVYGRRMKRMHLNKAQLQAGFLLIPAHHCQVNPTTPAQAVMMFH